jgi:hypothetical protein
MSKPIIFAWAKVFGAGKWGFLKANEVQQDDAESYNWIPLYHGDEITGLREQIDALQAQVEAHEDIFQRIRNWAEAYPLDIFPPVSKEEFADIHETLKREHNMPLDRVSASNMKHVITRVAAMIPPPPGTDNE